MISVQGLTVEFGSRPLLKDVSFVVNDSDRIALVGLNGAGKSTLLKILVGEQEATSGTVSRNRGLTIGYLPQQMKLSDETTLTEEVKKAFSHIQELDDEITALNREIADRTDYESDEYADLLNRLAHKTDIRTTMSNGSIDGQVEKTLTGLGFERSDFGRETREFSGGWRMRIEIAKILLQSPDVLLLDEPTNHLDIESIQWLEKFLKNRRGGLVLVSHDRAFIDNVTNRTIEIELGKIYDYSVNYSKFVELRKERIEQQRRAWENQQKLIHDTEDFIERFRYKATKAVQVQSRIKQLEKIERIEIDETDTSRLRLKFQAAPRSGDYPVIAEDVAKNYGPLNVFSGVTFTIKRGEKVAFVGKNGAGKSTLIKCIMGEIPFEGKLTIGHNVKIGYFAQNQAQMLDENLTVWETIDRVAVGDIRTRINDLLGCFMFGGERSEKKVKVLSGGEKSRLAMLKLLLEPVNLLILDEPTNHLDMRTKDILKDAISKFTGTVIVVSHDRYFLDGITDKVFEFGGGTVKEHLGGIYDFLQKKEIDNLNMLEVNTSPTAEKGELREVSSGKQEYEEQKARERTLRMARKAVSEAEEKVMTLEAEISALEDEISGGNVSDPAVYEKHAELTAKLEQSMAEWERASEELEKLETLNNTAK